MPYVSMYDVYMHVCMYSMLHTCLCMCVECVCMYANMLVYVCLLFCVGCVHVINVYHIDSLIKKKIKD